MTQEPIQFQFISCGSYMRDSKLLFYDNLSIKEINYFKRKTKQKLSEYIRNVH